MHIYNNSVNEFVLFISIRILIHFLKLNAFLCIYIIIYNVIINKIYINLLEKFY